MYQGTSNTFRKNITRLQTRWKRKNDIVKKKTFFLRQKRNETGQQIAHCDKRPENEKKLS